MTDLLTAAEMRAIEADAIASGAVTGLELMERAGRGAVDAILAEWPDLENRRPSPLVLCGPGNNGGDGLIVARLLEQRGFELRVCLYGDPETLPPDARTAFERWRQVGRLGLIDLDALGTGETAGCGLIVDALFGIGLTRPLEADLGAALGRLASQRPEKHVHRVALDIVSGLCADSGRPLTAKADEGGAVLASRQDLTVTFHAPKLGHYLNEGPDWCGKLRVVDIGLGPAGNGLRLGRAEARQVMKGSKDARPLAHKYDHGHALVLSGGVGRGGAARMAARGALRIGAGLVTVGCPPAALIENAARLEAVMLRAVRDADALAEMLGDARFNSIALGPGLGTGAREAGLIRAVLESMSARGPDPSNAGRAVVLDGDALTLLSQDAELFAMLGGWCVLTPHAGEFARLFPDISGRLAEPPAQGPAYSKLDAARDAARRAGCVILLKGPDTVIADPSGEAAISAAVYERRAPWLATAGAGDVLTGFVAGLLARGLPPLQAALSAAWLHVDCALAFGPGLVAEDLPEQLPRVLAGLDP